MFARIVLVVSSLFMITACESLNKKLDPNNPRDFGAISKNLNTFDAIPGNSSGARAGDRVYFAFDSAVLTQESQKTLERQADWLKKNAKVNVTVEGHCDERGTREYNLGLGERRASAVKNYLIKSGVTANRVATVSYGKERPSVLGNNEEAWTFNRRGVTVLNLK